MKSKWIASIAFISLILNVVLFIFIFKEEENIRPDTPIEMASLMMEAAGDDDQYKSIKGLLHQRYREVISEEKLQQITQMHTGGAEFFSYAVVNFKGENGGDDVLLLKLTDELDDGKIKIQHIKIVPDEMERVLID
ncbi:hypothetical protein [Pontibacillus yanchengensis]|uniref:Uncharacterized protein n=1 Tax=Pontibacillus yanchengensis Y32 TaxID=1385514 RepID=A0A0A2TGL7_9BACI|nr:hypothetical protein [Pontibacillus yanchengensis]KGP74714.1 hypothetical protein N782_00840 [Pontibacillus yanchengensis Y32]